MCHAGALPLRQSMRDMVRDHKPGFDAAASERDRNRDHDGRKIAARWRGLISESPDPADRALESTDSIGN